MKQSGFATPSPSLNGRASPAAVPLHVARDPLLFAWVPPPRAEGKVISRAHPGEPVFHFVF